MKWCETGSGLAEAHHGHKHRQTSEEKMEWGKGKREKGEEDASPPKRRDPPGISDLTGPPRSISDLIGYAGML